MGGCRPFHDLSAGETAAPDLSGECGGGKTPLQISRRKDPAYDRRESLGTEEKTSRTRDIHSKAFNPGLTPGGPLPILDRSDLALGSGDLLRPPLTLFGGYGLKEGNLLLHFAAFAFWALEFFLFIFPNFYSQGKSLFTFFTHELVCGHARPPFTLCLRRSNTETS